MKIAELRHVLYIQEPTVTQNTRGAESIVWVDSGPLRGGVRTVSGDERGRNEQVVPVAAHEITLRHPLPAGVELTPKCRIRWPRPNAADRYFGIIAIGEPDNRGRLRVLNCQELIGEDRVL